jgi:hypothetical protein
VHAAGRDLADRAHQQGRGAVLGEIAGGAGLERARRYCRSRASTGPGFTFGLEFDALDKLDARQRAWTCRSGEIEIIGPQQRQDFVAVRR